MEWLLRLGLLCAGFAISAVGLSAWLHARFPAESVLARAQQASAAPGARTAKSNDQTTGVASHPVAAQSKPPADTARPPASPGAPDINRLVAEAMARMQGGESLSVSPALREAVARAAGDPQMEGSMPPHAGEAAALADWAAAVDPALLQQLIRQVQGAHAEETEP